MFTWGWGVLFLLGSSALPIVSGRGESSIFDSQVERCSGCKADGPFNSYTGGASPKNEPVEIKMHWSSTTLKNGNCGPKQTCLPYKDPCAFHTDVTLDYKYGHHADGPVNWKLNGDLPKNNKKGVLIKGKKVTVIKEHSNDEATEWDCESSLVLTLDWTLNSTKRSRTLTFKCGKCN